MQHEYMANCLAELGNSHRLSVLRFLVKYGHKGAPVGDIQKALGIPASTLSHHLSRLAKVGLIRQEKQGRIIICTPEYLQLDAVIRFLQTECRTTESAPRSRKKPARPSDTQTGSDLKMAKVIPGY